MNTWPFRMAPVTYSVESSFAKAKPPTSEGSEMVFVARSGGDIKDSDLPGRSFGDIEPPAFTVGD
jgi:hypothetical protein